MLDAEDEMQWTESLTVDRPDTDVYRAISDLHEVQQWSAWVATVGGTPALLGDGTAFGSALVLRDATGGEHRLGLVSARLDRVELQLSGDGSSGLSGVSRRPLELGLVYRLQDVGASATIVMLDLSVRARVPRPVRRVAEPRLRRRLAALADLDLRQLKAHVEAGSAAA